jgi:hypothetical protein
MDVIRSKGEIKQFVNNLAITFDRRSAGGGHLLKDRTLLNQQSAALA